MSSLPNNYKNEVASIRRDHTTYLQAYTGTYANPDDVLRGRGRGQYQAYEDLKKDGHTYSVLQKRYLQVVAREWKVEPASTSRVDKKAADMVRYHLTHLAARAEDEDACAVGFDGLCYNLLDAILKGFKPGEILWGQDGAEVYPVQVKTRSQQRFGFGVGNKGVWELRLFTPEDMVIGEAVQKLYPRKFFVHSYGATDDNPYGVGIGRTIWWNVFFKKQGVKFWLQFIDKFASPTAVGKYPKGATNEQKSTLLAALNCIATDAGVAIPDGLEIELLEAARSGSTQSYEGLCSYMDSEISKTTLGETLSTEIGDRGSYAAAQTHDKVGQRLSKADADLLSDTLNRTLIKWICAYNLPNAKAPRLWRDFGEQENLDSRVQRDKTLFDMGFKLKAESVKEIYGDDYEEVQQGNEEITPEQFLANSGAAGLPMNGSDETKVAQDTQDVDLSEKLVSLSSSQSLPIAPNFAEQDKDGIDGYAEQLKERAAPLITNLVQQIRSVIEDAGDFEEARGQLEKLYPKLNTADFGELMAQAMIASEAAGRWEVLNEAGEKEDFAETRDEFLSTILNLYNSQSLLDLKSVLEESYTDGITAIRGAYLEGENIVGLFEDRIDSALTKRYDFTVTESEVSYKLQNPQEVANYVEPVDFAVKRTAPKSCPKGTLCGGSCISASKTCRKSTSVGATKKIAEVKRRAGGDKAKKTDATEGKKTTKDVETTKTAKAKAKTTTKIKSIKSESTAKKPASKRNIDLRVEIENINKKYEKEIEAARSEFKASASATRAKYESNKTPTNKEFSNYIKAQNELIALEDKRNKEVDAIVLKELRKTYQEPQPQMHHGMSISEKMWSVEHNGVKFHASGEFKADNPSVKTIKELLENEKLPNNFTKHTTDVYFSSQRNKNDSYWEKQYNIPGFTSGATGGTGSVVYYASNSGYATLTHEMGHNFAKARYGSTTPPEGSDYVKAAKKDGKHPKEYGNASRAEDIAETAKMFFNKKENLVLGEQNLMILSPERYKVFKRMIEDESYSG